MFWDHVAGVYDIFANFINRKTHRVLREKVSGLRNSEPRSVSGGDGRVNGMREMWK